MIWGKLIPLVPDLQSYELDKNIITIGRGSCDIKIVREDKRLSGRHCIIQKSEKGVTIKDQSTNGTYINSQKIGKNNQKAVQSQSQICLLNPAKTNQKFGFKIIIKQEKIEEREEKFQVSEGRFLQKIKYSLKCTYCLNIMLLPVNALPCNHHFCATCLTYLIDHAKGNAFNCVKCNTEIILVAHDDEFDKIIEDYLEANPHDQQNESPLANYSIFPKNQIVFLRKYMEQESKNKMQEENNQFKSIKSCQNKMKDQNQDTKVIRKMSIEEPIMNPLKIKNKQETAVESYRSKSVNQPKSKRMQVKPDDVSSDISAKSQCDAPRTLYQRCKECQMERNGFKCKVNQVHVQCHTCAKSFALRDEYPQSCFLCNTFFCNLYLPPCSKSGVKLALLKDRRDSCKLQLQVFRNNKIQMQIVKNYLLSVQMNAASMFDHCLDMMDRGKLLFMYSKKLMLVVPGKEREVRLEKSTPVCDKCWKDVWFQMVFAFRTQRHDKFPPTIKSRSVCHWGVNCKTMKHKIDHAQRYNHMVFQTKFL